MNLEPHPTLDTLLIRGIPEEDTLNEATRGYDKVVIFGDFNNMCKGMYYPETVQEIVNRMIQNNGEIPNILFMEWLRVQNYFEAWGKLNNKKVSNVYFCEAGESYYHKNLFKDYKKNRRHSTMSLPEGLLAYFDNDIEKLNEMIRTFLLSTWTWISTVAKNCNVATIRLENLDADFIPEYVLRKSGCYREDVFYIILSNDGDMIQTLDYADNIAIIDNSTIIRDSNWIGSKKYLVMDESKDLNLSPDRIILYKAIVGDSSDCIPGVKGIGGKGFFKDFVTKIPDDIRCDDLPKLKEFLMTMNDNKVAKKVLENWDTFCTMTKLVSFRLLIEGLYSIPSRMKDLQEILDSNMSVFNENSNLMSLIPNSVTIQK